MATITWKGQSGDWSTASDWSSGTVPGSGDTAVFTGSGYTATISTAETVGNVQFDAAGALLDDYGALTLGGTFSLQAGTFALAFGSLAGGTLAMAGGTLEAAGGTLSGTAVDGTLDLSPAGSTLYVQNGLTMAGAGGSGSGTIALTGGNSVLTFLGNQTLAHAVVTLGFSGIGGASALDVSHLYGATSGGTLTLASSVWLNATGQQGQIIVGAQVPDGLNDELINQGTITASAQGGTLAMTGGDTFVNQGTIGISNGATLDIATGIFSNTGSIIVADATLDLGGTFASSLLGQLGNVTLTQGVVEIGGDIINTGGTLHVSSSGALGPLELAGTITGGTVVDAGGGFTLSPGTGVLNDVAYQGTLQLTGDSALTLTGGSSITAGSITGSDASLFLQGTTTLSGATLSVGSSTGTASLGTVDPFVASTATTATLAASDLVQQTGKFAAIDANSQTPIPNLGLADTMISQGTIIAGFAGGTLTIGGGGTFINQGQIEVSNGDTLVVDPAVFSNLGTMSVTGGADVVLGGPPNFYGQSPQWSNAGLISVNNGSLTLSGEMKTGQLGTIVSSQGTVALTGTLNNSGATLKFGSGGQLSALSLAGTIQGGTITDAGGLLAVGAGGSALLDGVTDDGILNLGNAGAWLRVDGGLSLSGTARVTGAGAYFGFQGNETFDAATVQLGASGAAAVLDVIHDYTQYGGSTLTLGPKLVVQQAGALGQIGSALDQANDAIVNQGTITAGIAGGTLVLTGAAFTNRGSISVSGGDTLLVESSAFNNLGTLAVSNAALDIADSLTMAELGNFSLSNATLVVSGTLGNSGGTLSIGAGTAIGRMSLTGTIAGGVVLDYGQGLAVTGGATLSDVAYQGVLDLSRPFQTLTSTNGLTVTDTTGTQAGTIMLTGAASKMIVEGNETLNNLTVYIGSATQTYYGQHVAAPELDAGPQSTLTLGPNSLVRSGGLVGWLGDCGVGNWTDTIVDQGTLMAATANGLLSVDASTFIDTGSIIAGNYDNIAFAGVDMVSEGGMSIAAGSNLLLALYNYYAAPNAGATVYTNDGTVHMSGGSIQELTGSGLFPTVAIVNSAGALIQGLGNIVAPVVNNGVIESKYGPNLSISGSVTGSGTLLADAGTVLELENAVSASQTVAFTGAGATLRLDQAQNFNATVLNYATSDSIDITGTPVNTVAISNGTLVLGTGYGQFKLNSPTPLGGVIAAGADAHGGEMVTYTQQVKGGGAGGGNIVTISVAESNMLFWASPLGDIFQGTSAELQGSNIANWTTADSLDFVDMLGTKTTVSYVQATGQGTITVTDGTHTDDITLIGTYNATWFHVQTDQNGGALITYHQ
jgi:hypothetical protein